MKKLLPLNQQSNVGDKLKNLEFSSSTDPKFQESYVEDINSPSNTLGHSNIRTYNIKKNCVTFGQFLQTEITRGYQLEHDEKRFLARREKIYSFIKIPKEVEKFMIYGFFQCADSFLFIYTFLPLRFILALWTYITTSLKQCLGKKQCKIGKETFLTPAEICDLLKGIIVLSCWIMTWKVDTSMMYHLVKSQSVIKLYIFYNMLEVGDRLCSAVGQDTIDALLWTATEPESRTHGKRSHNFGTGSHLCFAIAYVLTHTILVLFQTTTLNVAINSSNKALLTIMMSNNFVELKGSVFKKFDKNNLFQLSCSDVRERFHLAILLLAVTLQTLKEYAWRADRLAILLPDCILLLLAEVLVDWVKHAFITRFNELCSTVYREYTVSLAYDMAQTRQEMAYSDPSDLVARRMGFIPLPLGVAIARVLSTTMTTRAKPVNILLLVLAYLILITLRILINLLILGQACNVINMHSQTIATNQETKTSEKIASDLKSTQAGDQNLPEKIFTDSSVILNRHCNSPSLLQETCQNQTMSLDLDNIKFQPLDNFLSLPKNVERAGSEPLLLTQ